MPQDMAVGTITMAVKGMTMTMTMTMTIHMIMATVTPLRTATSMPMGTQPPTQPPTRPLHPQPSSVAPPWPSLWWPTAMCTGRTATTTTDTPPETARRADKHCPSLSGRAR